MTDSASADDADVVVRVLRILVEPVFDQEFGRGMELPFRPVVQDTDLGIGMKNRDSEPAFDQRSSDSD